MPRQTEIVSNQYFLHEEDLKYLPPYFQHVEHTPEEVQCRVIGEWPKWASGSLHRMGMEYGTIPVCTDGSKPAAVLQHFFDGLAMLHKFRMDNGKVYFRSRYVTEGVKRNALKDGYVRMTYIGINPNTSLIEVQDPCYAKYGRQQALYLPQGHLEPDELVINVGPRRAFKFPPSQNPKDWGKQSDDPEREELLVLTDFNAMQVCDQDTLQPKRMLTYAAIDPALEGFGICTHAPKDRVRREVYNYVIEAATGTLYVFALDYAADPTKLRWKTPLPCKPGYVHSIAMTQQFVVFIRMPLFMDMSDPAAPVLNRLKVETGEPTRFFILDKESGKLLAQYHAPSFLFYHAVNGYDFVDQDGKTSLHIDLCSYEPIGLNQVEYMFSNIVDPAGEFAQGYLVRYEMKDLETQAQQHPDKPGRVTVVNAIAGTGVELPRIAKSASMQPGYRYVYGTGGNVEAAPGSLVPMGQLSNGLKAIHQAFFNSIVKTDWQTGTFVRWTPTNGESAPCEPIFIPRPDSIDEDDGVVLTIIINREGTYSVLVVLDAKTMTEVARAEMPKVYPLGAHGTFIENYHIAI